MKAIDASGIDAEPDLVLVDMCESASILQKDGDNYEYAHRSFQEYFYAKFVASDREYSREEKLSEFLRFDDIVDMVADMDRAYFETDFLAPRASLLMKKLSGIEPSEKPDLIIVNFFSGFGVRLHKDDDTEDKKKLVVFFSVSHDDDEYQSRVGNLTVYDWSYRTGCFERKPRTTSELGDSQILEALGFTRLEQVDGNSRFPLKHQNRRKLIALGGADFAERLKLGVEELSNYLQQMQSRRRSALGEKLKGRGKR